MSDPTDVNKSGIDKIVAEKLGLDVKRIDEVTDLFLATIIERLAEGLNVDLKDFGTFETYDRKERAGRNPKTGEAIQIPAKRVAKFKAWKKMRDAVSENTTGS